MIGTSLSHYKIIEKLGQGGQGEVYLAEDSRLDRKVALKILPEHLSDRAELRERFEREARAVSSLNHPHICTLYDIGEQDGIHYLVMEHLVGETLEARLAKGPLPLEQTLEYAIQIADALDKAHRQGVVHRDLKPGNIMLVKSGAKLLDFGLAKLQAAETPTNLSALPTEQANLTAEGTILGTLQYMAPEQLEAKEADSRTDIFAFGAVVYEMATGKKAFEGKSQASLIAAIMGQDPRPMSELQPMTPELLDWVVKRCLAKDPDERVQTAADLMAELRLVMEVRTQVAASSPITTRPLWRRAIPWSITLVTVVVGITGWWVTRSGAVTPVPLQRFSIDLPEGTILPTGTGRDFAISPDGQSLVYVAEDVAAGASEKRLYLRRLDELGATPIPGTEGAAMPFFSPDGQWVGFRGQDVFQIRRVPLSGGDSFTICDQCAEGSWGDDGSILFQRNGSLWRIPEVGSSPELLAAPMPDQGVPGMSRPILLPGGQAVLFGIGFLEFGGVGVLSLESNEVIVVSTDGADPLYSSTGHILFARGNTLFAVPFDVEGFEVTGPAVPVLQGVRVENGGALQVDVSPDGLLVYAPAGAEMGTQLTWVDREGNVESVLDEQWRVFYSPRISPDGKQVAVQINEGGETDIWIHDSGTFRLLTTDGMSANPIWTPDGSGVAFTSGSAASFAIRWTTADGASEVKTLLSSEYPVLPAAWSPEGNQLVFQENSPNPNLFVADVRDGGSRTAFLKTDFSEMAATLSHSGKWLAYVSDRSGSNEVYVRPFPGPGAEQVVSRGGGVQPVWSPDDTELFYRDSGHTFLMVASLQSEPFQVLSREVVFPISGSFWGGDETTHYDVHPDSQRFLMMNMRGSEGSRPKINVVLNWFEELKRLVPTP